MPNLTKRDIVLKIAEENPTLTQTQIFNVLQKTLDHITDALSKGQKVEIRNFGVFEVLLRKQKLGRNPKNPGVGIPIPARAAVKFLVGKVMRERVRQLTEKLKK